ncbi:L,D-transpeptidase family protein [Vibrio sp. LaRot3]|uniref:L,D-transpeptidase family protein n=1 Tax=Vibrio sp. LaRot3 TaxID=2998829 RepID=UPI0022CE18ED|nr:L,D-transpeptidase family protein [Vibrio sp. LaRot3]MDA0147758.1 L,D-transpeptidase family protein [Vibrio sp. LaRot3]
MLRNNVVLLVLILMPMPSWALSYFEQIGWVNDQSQVPSMMQYTDVVESIYRNNGEHLVWFDLQQSSQLEFQLEVIQAANFSPLFSRKLNHLRYLRKSNRWYEYDLLATDTMLAYMVYAEQAKHKGMEWFFESKLTQPLPPASDEIILALRASIESQQLGALIDAYTPDGDGYNALIQAYLHLVKLHEEPLPAYHQHERVLRTGDLLPNREALLSRLAVLDINIENVDRNVAYYDATLEPAIKSFQRMHGLNPDGVIGPKTVKWLNRSIKERYTTLALNAERARMWPEQRDTIILVNVPRFEMTYWHDGETVFESRVVVGREARKTPVMTTNLDSIVLNPTWNIPWKIMVEDIIPKIKQDAAYLQQKNIAIIPKWGSDEVIDPAEIDWQHLNPEAFPYRMRQMSGNYNALGLYKFNTPNRRAIYLHDTPSKSLFNKESRAFSSGCIRVKHADKFATLLMENQGLDIERIAQAEGEPNKAIPLRRRIPVHIIYQTAWSEGGVVQYRDDVYSFDR